MEGSNEDDILQKIRDFLDYSIDENTAKNISKEKEDQSTRAARSETFQISEEYIDVDDYCKFLKDCGDKALASAPLDSRSLISAQQAKFDSQQMPHSLSDFHNRIESFVVKRWSHIPDSVSAFECARFGWKLTEWGFLSCVTCKQILHVPSQVSKHTGIDWALRLRKDMESSGHLSTCPWTRIPTPVDILTLPKGDTVELYLTDALASFKKLQKYINVDGMYLQMMTELDLNWVRDLTSWAQQHYDIVDPGVTQEMMRDLTLLLAISGWRMVEECKIRCSLCLREVSLQLYYENQKQDVLQDSLNTSDEMSISLSESSRKSFDPVKNHWSWCPWRLFLLNKAYGTPNISLTEENPEDAITRSPHGGQFESLSVPDYQRLLEMFKESHESLKLRYNSQVTSGRDLLNSVSALMDEFLSSHDTAPSKSPVSMSPNPPNGVGMNDDNDIIIKAGSKRQHTPDAEDSHPAKRSRPL